MRYLRVDPKIRIYLEDHVLSDRDLLKKTDIIVIPHSVQYTGADAWGPDAFAIDHPRFVKRTFDEEDEPYRKSCIWRWSHHAS